MSRAFVKDDDDRPEPALRRPVGDRPNYVTAAGLARLREAAAAARTSGDARNAAYFEERVASAIVPDAGEREPGVVSFGATVTLRDDRGRETRLRIVGEDESEPARGALAWSSPFAQALLDARVGERVTVRRPAGDARYLVEAVEFPE